MSIEDQIGLEREEPFTVGGVLTTNVGGTIEATVLSTCLLYTSPSPRD